MRRKAFHDDENETGFDFFLAEKLHMPVARMRAELSQLEWMQWTRYYGVKAQRQQLENLKAGGS
jgi:hypothetical protein